ncbi:unnamed protein product [Pleuronectes platessa]|uniref:Uncharacterized protein n=1 Tax=Pleuronectes platessa TaxID=8262 RepID=A0A9N7U0V7_PLEPL|nr:unnamed protein product [Pleuronectes platessa]
MEQVAKNAALGAEHTFLKRQLDAENTALKKKAVYEIALLEENIALKKKLDAANKALMVQVAEKAALGIENFALKKQLDTENTAPKKKGVYEIALIEENIALKKKLDAGNKSLREQVAEKTALGAENTALKRQLDVEYTALRKQAVFNDALVEENIVLKKKLDAANTVIKDHVAEKAILENRAAENADLAADRHAVKKQLTAKNATLRKQIASTAFQLHQAREDLIKIEKSVDTARSREEELEKKLDDLQLQDLEKVRVEQEWKAKFEDLQENYEAKLRNSVLEQEASFKQIEDLMNQIREAEEKLSAEQEDSRLVLKTNEYREKVQKEKKEKKKQEKKEQQEREKKEKEEREELKKREKKEKEEREGEEEAAFEQPPSLQSLRSHLKKPPLHSIRDLLCTTADAYAFWYMVFLYRGQACYACRPGLAQILRRIRSAGQLLKCKVPDLHGFNPQAVTTSPSQTDGVFALSQGCPNFLSRGPHTEKNSKYWATNAATPPCPRADC